MQRSVSSDLLTIHRSIQGILRDTHISNRDVLAITESPSYGLLIQTKDNSKDGHIPIHIEKYSDLQKRLSSWCPIQASTSSPKTVFRTKVIFYTLMCFVVLSALGLGGFITNTELLTLIYIVIVFWCLFLFALLIPVCTVRQLPVIVLLITPLVLLVYPLILFFELPFIPNERKFIFSFIALFMAFLMYIFYNKRILNNTLNIINQTQSQLIVAQKMASLGQLVAGVAHEINNPINYIKSNIEPLKDYVAGMKRLYRFMEENVATMDENRCKQYQTLRNEEDFEFTFEDTERLIESFQSGSNRIGSIVADLRQYSSGGEDKAEPYNVRDILESIISFLQPYFGENITLHKTLEPVQQLTCNPGRLSQVFMNLCRNATQAIKEHGNIWVDLYQQNENIIIKLRDDGEGIPSENLGRIFDPFFTTKPVGSGTGLGLSVSRTIIEQHNGTISVDGEVGKGTTFTIVLPIKR